MIFQRWSSLLLLVSLLRQSRGQLIFADPATNVTSSLVDNGRLALKCRLRKHRTDTGVVVVLIRITLGFNVTASSANFTTQTGYVFSNCNSEGEPFQSITIYDRFALAKLHRRTEV